MNFDDLKDQFREKWQEFLNQIQESSTYNSIREQYDNLTPDKQKLLLASIGVIVGVIIFSIPLSYLSTSSDSTMQFNEVRQSMRDLFRVRSLPDLGNPLPSAFDISQTQASIRNTLSTSQLLPDQIGDIALDEQFKTPLARPPIMQSAVAIILKNLNAAQVIDIGKKLQTMSNSSKLMSVEIQAQRSKGMYFDVVYKLVSFYFPQEEPPPTEQNNRRRPGRGR